MQRLAAVTIGVALLAVSGAAVALTDAPENRVTVSTETIARSHTPAALTERLQTVALPVVEQDEDLVTEDQLTQALAGIVVPPNPAARIAELEATIRELEAEIARLTAQLNGFSTTVTTLQELIADLTTRVAELETQAVAPEPEDPGLEPSGTETPVEEEPITP